MRFLGCQGAVLLREIMLPCWVHMSRSVTPRESTLPFLFLLCVRSHNVVLGRTLLKKGRNYVMRYVLLMYFLCCSLANVLPVLMYFLSMYPALSNYKQNYVGLICLIQTQLKHASHLFKALFTPV